MALNAPLVKTVAGEVLKALRVVPEVVDRFSSQPLADEGPIPSGREGQVERAADGPAKVGDPRSFIDGTVRGEGGGSHGPPRGVSLRGTPGPY